MHHAKPPHPTRRPCQSSAGAPTSRCIPVRTRAHPFRLAPGNPVVACLAPSECQIFQPICHIITGRAFPKRFSDVLARVNRHILR